MSSIAAEEMLLKQMIRWVGDDPEREGVLETPKRIRASWNELYCGYQQDPQKILTAQFSAETYDQLVLLKDIELYSMCEHHMLPFYGKAHIAYIPKNKVVGISKLARLLDCFARRLQIQERIGEQVTSAIMEYLDASGAACIIEACHMCMRMRGVGKQGSMMVTSSLKGAFAENATTRAELLQLVKA